MTSSEDIRSKFNAIDSVASMSSNEMINTLSNFLPEVQNFLSSTDEMEFSFNPNFEKIENTVSETIPQSGKSMDDILDFVRKKIMPYFQFENVNFYGYIPRSPSHVSMLADALVPMFNQFLGNAIGSPSANAVEALTIKWIGNLIGYKENYFGTYTIGGSSANFDGIYTGLINQLPWNTRELGFIGDRRPVIYITDQSHICISKAIRHVGLGMASIRKIPTTQEYAMDIEELQKQIKHDLEDEGLIPSMIVGTCGTTNTGAIDDFVELANIAKEHDLWLHVDAAYGGFAKISNHQVTQKMEGLERADSIAIDTHKWFYTPMEGGLSLVKNAYHLANAYGFDRVNEAEYLQDTSLEKEFSLVRNFSEYGYPLSRRWRGFMVWMNFQFYGIDNIRKMITKNILLADYFRQLIEEDDELVISASTNLGIVCFKHPDDQLTNYILKQMMKQGRRLIGRTKLRGESTLRICILNEHTTIKHIDALFAEIKEIIDTYY